ncbi:MAG: prepilin-type N-terminal cleavage/methylation domain-containing protein [Gammaproteobacteria bacterium]|nr:prepilin-type N-terminal cleavage/methylation domain-containing protein [Gammaproteobacteria bacterium]
MFNKKQAGLTLIEMMIALVLGLFVVGVIITVFSTNVRSSTESIKMIRLNQELRGVMTFMSDELKRSGYSSDPNVGDFMQDFNVSATCIRYSYDENGDDIRDANERFGFKLESNTVKWTTSGGDPNTPPTAPDCGTGTWTDITDPNLASIATLNFDLTGSVNTNGDTGLAALTATTGVSVYDVTITLTGTTDLPHSSDANDPSRTVTETIRIRNEDPK